MKKMKRNNKNSKHNKWHKIHFRQKNTERSRKQNEGIKKMKNTNKKTP